MASSSNVTIHRSWQDCVQRLLVRGLIVVGTGDTEYDALYDLLSCRFIIPIGAAWPLRVLSFLKLTFLEGISWKITRRLFHVDARSSCEKKIIRLARQTPLSCAEIIKCIEMEIRRLKDGYDVLDKLYNSNDLNCDNFAQAVRESTVAAVRSSRRWQTFTCGSKLCLILTDAITDKIEAEDSRCLK